MAISIINVAMVFAEALSACAATKLVSQISLNKEDLRDNIEELPKQTSIIQSLRMYPDNQ